jgi:BASS family bile acid:Na+ symporter
MMRLLRRWTDLFVVWVIVFSALALWKPAAFTWMRPGIVPGLGLIMFGMGMTLVPADFLRVAEMPRAVLCGVIGQFLIMPLVAWGMVTATGLEPALAMGFIILGCCPGGTASNVIAYLARADVALSVTMTACSTLLAIVLTPLLTLWLGGTLLPVDGWAMFVSVVKIVLVPVLLGLGLRVWLDQRLKGVIDVFPAISVLVIVLIIACVVGLNSANIAQSLGLVGFLVILHNAFGLSLGYALATAFRLPRDARRTVAIEVGMQNSGLGVALANAHFAATPLTALPSALFSAWHNLSGSLLASWWSRSASGQEHLHLNAEVS